jgi:hypothetical protein
MLNLHDNPAVVALAFTTSAPKATRHGCTSKIRLVMQFCRVLLNSSGSFC